MLETEVFRHIILLCWLFVREVKLKQTNKVCFLVDEKFAMPLTIGSLIVSALPECGTVLSNCGQRVVYQELCFIFS